MNGDPVEPWRVRHREGRAGELHALDLLGADSPLVWVLEAVEPALVLGSAQPDGDVDRIAAARMGIEVVRRRSGGAAVLLQPGASSWIDVTLPRWHPRWTDDVRAASCWMGRAWSSALASHGVATTVSRAPMERTALGEVVCFADVGPGEVLLGGAKVVGVSQRRTRFGARFQCVAFHRWDAAMQAELLAPGLARVRRDERHLEQLATVPLAASAHDLAVALAQALEAVEPPTP